MKRRTLVTLTLVGIPVLLGFASNAVSRWHTVFDDAFITYRYAANLAAGHGITWNPGLAPTEGYTNFLLVVLLAPFIRLGFEPLLVTRILSYVSAAAMAAILFAVAKRRHSCSTPTAMMIAALILLAPQTRYLCLAGLETVLYGLFLLTTFHVGVVFLVSRRTGTAVLLGVLLVLTMWLRPEAALLCPVAGFLYCATLRRQPTPALRPLLPGMAVVFVAGAAYLAWKAGHFGHLLPNPFYIKMAGGPLVSTSGVRSVFSFGVAHALLLALLCGSGVLCFSRTAPKDGADRVSVLLGLGLSLAYAVLFVHTDTLMDTGGRFMYPLLPILIYAAMPVLASALTDLENRTEGRRFLFPVLVLAFLLAFGPADLFLAYANAKRAVSRNGPDVSDSLMQKELQLAHALSRFPDIESVRVAFGDSGVIPYYTRSVWLDVAGLNDGVIARENDKKVLVDHFFSFRPDLVIHPGQKDFSWLRHGHGPLGDYASWSGDPRWDGYRYVGTCRTGRPHYDLQFLVRKSSRFRESLVSFLEKQALDGRYDPFPYAIGTYAPDRNARPRWIPRERPRR